MQRREVDVVVIGAGTAGLSAQRAARKEGASALLVDRGPLGTTCARVGCMPSKLLIAAAHAAHAVHAAPMFGVHTQPPRVDGVAVLQRVQRERDRFVGFVVDDCRALEERGELLRGSARLVAADTLQVDEHTQVKFRSLVVATGSSPVVPPALRKLGAQVLTTDSVFELPDLPSSVLVIGSGAIGLELGQALHRLGVRVTVLGRNDTVGPLRDPAVKAAAKAALAGEFELYTRGQLGEVHVDDAGVSAQFEDDGQAHHGTWARVLVAAGRSPNLRGLGLELAGVLLDEEGRARQLEPGTLQVGSTPVFLAGDASGLRPLLHEAADEGHIAGGNAARFPGGVAPQPRRTRLSVVFTDPGLAAVGGGSTCAPADTHAFGEVDWGRQGRARVIGKNVGRTRIYASRDDEVLRAAEIAGPGAEHMAHLLAWAVQQELTVTAALRMPFYHPVLEEGLRTALQALRTALHASTESTALREPRAGEQTGDAKK